ncbi:hypothetical protein [Mycobacterium leprae]|uniref:hypothetical protein n=1 Tax=Mycobacterium leprae TaxID=1769 RepID=UPI000A846663
MDQLGLDVTSPIEDRVNSVTHMFGRRHGRQDGVVPRCQLLYPTRRLRRCIWWTHPISIYLRTHNDVITTLKN